jgi:citrate synthase
VTTGITQLDPGAGPAYRGHPAAVLAGTRDFEAVAELLWGDPDWEQPAAPWEPWPVGPCPPTAGLDPMRWAVLMAGAHDAWRSDHRAPAVQAGARRVIATMLAVLRTVPPPVRSGTEPDQPGGSPRRRHALARTVAASLCRRPSATVARAVNGALVLLADHELATSTLAVRVAASTRADLCDALEAGLATLAGPLHGGASGGVHELLVEVGRLGAEGALARTLRTGGEPPGFGHSAYPAGDPRFAALRSLVDPIMGPRRRAQLDEVVRLAGHHDLGLPNIDLALGALTWAAGMEPAAGRVLFALARTAGWTAHYLEELKEPPLRFRARAVYAVGGADHLGP